MSKAPSIVITADELSRELRTISSSEIVLLMPVGPLTRKVPIASIDFHAATVELRATFGETLSFPATDNAEIRRSLDVTNDRKFTRYELTFPLGEYFALIVAG